MFEDFDLLSTLASTGAGLLLGVVISLFYMYKSTYNKSFIVTLVLLPAIVGAVISIVNGNIGTGIAVMGAFSLVRFPPPLPSFRARQRRSASSSLPWRSGLGNGYGIHSIRGGVHSCGRLGRNASV